MGHIIWMILLGIIVVGCLYMIYLQVKKNREDKRSHSDDNRVSSISEDNVGTTSL